MSGDEDDDFNRLLAGGNLTGSFDIPKDISGRDAIKHNEDAVDYEDEDELADEELPDEEPPSRSGSIDALGVDDLEDVPEPPDGITEYGNDFDDDDDWTRQYTDEGVRVENTDYALASDGDFLQAMDEGQALAQSFSMTADARILEQYFPDFTEGSVLKMNSLFGPKPSKLSLPKAKTTRSCVPTRAGLEVEVDQKSLFKSNVQRSVNTVTSNVIRVALNDQSADNVNEVDGERKGGLTRELLIAATDWNVDELEGSTASSEDEPADVPFERKRELQNEELYDSEDEYALLNDYYRPRKKFKLDMNDANLLFVDEQPRRTRVIKRTSELPTNEKQLLQRYNISNDRAYDMLKENYQSKVRSTIGNLTIDHSMVALRLQSPHYKVKLSKAQMRSHHRPSFIIKPNTTIQFFKLKQRKKKRDKGKHITQLLSKSSDLTLGDSAPFFMLEYSEEFPLVLSNFGMGSKLINYYRKKSAEDTTRPKLSTGETHVLSTQDRSAFWNFGFVEPGHVVPTLYNRMIRAPVFRHDPPKTDFLLVRTTGGGLGQRYYLRSVPFIFAVGQSFPVTTIPGPHSRKVTTASKNRLKMVVYRVLNQNDRHRLLVKDISSHFPDQNDMQNRQRLKEFMEYQRAGEDQGFWKVKASEPLPNEESIRAMISPEDITLLEAMQVGQQHLEDAGYGKTVEDDNDDQDGMSIEEQLAPWNITRNFINATQGKAMLQLHGEGDPSGRGEAFSFLRTSMKGGFKAIGESVNDQLDKSKYGGHSYNVAVQQKLYDDEIARIWYQQKRSLESTKVHDSGWEDVENKRDGDQRVPSETPAPDDDSMSMFSQDSTAKGQQRNKVLRITRFVKDKNGTRQRRVDVVRDPNVIRAYIKRRQKVEDAARAQSLASSSVGGLTEKLLAENMAPTDDAERNRRNKKILEGELARLQRNQDRRIARKAQKVGNDPSATTQSGKGIGKGKSTTRKCATCGAIGHIRTNKACPLYNERFGGASDLNMPPPSRV